MGMKALVVIEIKTRLIELSKQLDKLIALLKRAGPEVSELHELQIEEMKLRLKELEDDHDLMRLFDDSEWGRFDQTMNSAIKKLSHDISAVHSAIESPLVPA